MPRPQVHTTDAMLDAARDLLLEAGSWSATMDAIAQASGAPTGSLYHRFGSRDELIARLWVRAVHRSQATFIAALQPEDAREAALGAALSIFDFCDEHPADAQLLVAFRRADLIRSAEGTLAEELTELNEPVRRAVFDLARRLYGRRSRAAIERTIFAVFDLPYGAVRRHLIAGDPLPTNLRADLALAVRAVLEQ
jgi:AcrR family transcriptional regulator